MSSDEIVVKAILVVGFLLAMSCLYLSKNWLSKTFSWVMVLVSVGAVFLNLQLTHSIILTALIFIRWGFLVETKYQA